MALPTVPYVRRARDTSDYTRRLSDLIGDQSSLQAEDAYRRGMTTANMWNTIGQTAGAGIQRVMEARSLKKKEEKGEQEKNRLKQIREMVSVLPKDRQAQAFRESGFWEEGDRVASFQQDNALKEIQIENARAQQGMIRAQRVSRVMDGIMKRPPGEQHYYYSEALPELKKLAGPELASQLPDMFDSGIAASIREQAMTFEQGFNEHIRLGDRLAKDFGDSLIRTGKSLALTTDQKGWDGAIAAEPNADVQPLLKKYFGDYSPDNVHRAGRFAGVAPEDPAQVALTKWRALYKAAGQEPSAEDELRMLNAINVAKQVPTAGGQPSTAQLQAAERFKADEYRRLEALVKKIADEADKEIRDNADDPNASQDTRNQSAAARELAKNRKDDAYHQLETVLKPQLQKDYVSMRNQAFPAGTGGGGGPLSLPGPAPVPTAPLSGLRPGSDGGTAPSVTPTTRVASPVVAPPAPDDQPPPPNWVGPLEGDMLAVEARKGQERAGQFQVGQPPMPSLAGLLPAIGRGASWLTSQFSSDVTPAPSSYDASTPAPTSPPTPTQTPPVAPAPPAAAPPPAATQPPAPAPPPPVKTDPTTMQRVEAFVRAKNIPRGEEFRLKDRYGRIMTWWHNEDGSLTRVK